MGLRIPAQPPRSRCGAPFGLAQRTGVTGKTEGIPVQKSASGKSAQVGSERLTDSQSMVLVSGPHCRDEFCTQLAHYFVCGHGFAVEPGNAVFHFLEARLSVPIWCNLRHARYLEVA